MHIATHKLNLRTRGNNQCDDITPQVQEVVDQERIHEGRVTVFVPGSTAAVTTLEYEPGVVEDVKTSLERFFPTREAYAHHRTAGDDNGAAHQRAAFLGPSLTVPVFEGRLTLGTWQQIAFIDCDNRPRDRNVIVQVMGRTR